MIAERSFERGQSASSSNAMMPRPPGEWMRSPAMRAAEIAARPPAPGTRPPVVNAWQDYRRGAATSQMNGQQAHSQPQGATNRWRAKRGPQGEYLEVIDWAGMEILPVRKDFSMEHPVVAARSEEECEVIRAMHSINVIKNTSDAPLPKPVVRFEEAPFPDWCVAALHRHGFKQPTPIQVQAWPVVLKGHDFVGIAETGSGKTVSYLLPMLVHIMAQPEIKPGEGPVGMVLVPTRDLCMQVAQHVKSFTEGTDIVCQALYGGADIDQQARQLASRMDIAVATPGRLIALLNYKYTNLRRATYLVLDEADELCGHGFGEQVRLIMSQVRPDRQALLFSATWPKNVETLAAEICYQAPIHINVGSVNLSACKSIKQRLKKLQDGETKFGVLCSALNQIRSEFASGARALVFCNFRTSVPILVQDLRDAEFCCEGFHGDQTQNEREEVLKQFCEEGSAVWILVCTQILGRGFDFRNVRFVINFDMPSKIVEYVHRIGRTGRAGELGYSLSLLVEGDLFNSRELVQVLKESEQEVPVWLSRAAKWRYQYQGMQRSTEYRGKNAETVVPSAPMPAAAANVPLWSSCLRCGRQWQLPQPPDGMCPDCNVLVHTPIPVRWDKEKNGVGCNGSSTAILDAPTDHDACLSSWGGRGRGRRQEFLRLMKNGKGFDSLLVTFSRGRTQKRYDLPNSHAMPVTGDTLWQ